MEGFIKNIKKKLSVDNIVDMMKESDVIDEKNVKEEDVRRTLQKLDPNALMDVDELAAKLNEISDDINKTKVDNSSTVAKVKQGVLIKSTPSEETASSQSKPDNVFHLNDDFH